MNQVSIVDIYVRMLTSQNTECKEGESRETDLLVELLGKTLQQVWSTSIISWTVWIDFYHSGNASMTLSFLFKSKLLTCVFCLFKFKYDYFFSFIVKVECSRKFTQSMLWMSWKAFRMGTFKVFNLLVILETGKIPFIHPCYIYISWLWVERWCM